MKTKKAMLEYIEATRARIEDAPNHGGSNNWWYPSPWTVAYNVKMYVFPDVDKLREHMSAAQNSYYQDDHTLFSPAWDDLLETEWYFLRNDLLELPCVEDVRQSGRSGGWCEVTYTAINDADTITEDDTSADIARVYADAVALEKAEKAVDTLIKDRHASLNKYIKSKAYYTDITNEKLLTDEDIKDIYSSKADVYREKANAI